MSDEWLQVRHDLPDEPEVSQIAEALGYDDPDLAVAKLIRLWSWFDKHTIDGNAPVTMRALLERHCGAPGIVKAVEDVGWFHLKDGVISVHEFERYISKSAKKRALGRKRKRKHKERHGSAASVTPSSSSSIVSSSLNKKKLSAANLALPKYLDTESGRKSVDEWITYRRVDQKKPVTETQLAKTFKRFEAEPEFTAAVDHTISNGWQGLREPDDERSRTATGQTTGRGRKAGGGNRRDAGDRTSRSGDGYVFDPVAEAGAT